MTDLEISRNLALAIGWRHYQMIISDGKVRCYRDERQWSWQLFDYMDWRVIGPIAAKYDCFPYKNSAGVWVCTLGGYHKPWPFHAGDTPQKAIAMAVIERSKT